MSPRPPMRHGRASNAMTVVAGTLVLGVVGLIVWAVGEVLLLVFAGILLAVLLRGLADGMAAVFRIPVAWSLAAVFLCIAILLALIGWLLGAEMISQLDELVPQLQKIWAQLHEQLRHYEWGRALLASTNVKAVTQGHTEWLARITGGAFSSAFGVIASLLIIFFIGLYGAARPHLYVDGLLQLVPGWRRTRAAEVLNALTHTLRWWLIGTFIKMTLVGLATSIGLQLLGMPLALALGLIAFLFDFVPYLGALLASVPAILVALAVSPVEAAYVASLYLGIHAAENYLVSPMVDQRSVNLPPALAVCAQLLMGASSLGLLGVMFATPLAAVAIVLIRMMYVEDYLGERPHTRRDRHVSPDPGIDNSPSGRRP